MPGLFITLEGIDFCGKTTQAKKLVSYLRRKGYQVLLVREPGGDKVAERIRGVLLSKANSHMTHLTELFLYEAARSQLTQNTIIPALKLGKAVVCDRYFDSTLAYQGYGRGLNKKMIIKFNQTAALGLKPDLTLILDVPVKVSLMRGEKRGKKKDRLEKEKFEFHHRIRKGFLAIARRNPKRIEVVDGTKNIEETWQKVRKVVDAFLDKSNKV
jgi:dTMP kinase